MEAEDNSPGYVSDDEPKNMGRQSLPVARLPGSFSGEPMDGEQYLFTVRYVPYYPYSVLSATHIKPDCYSHTVAKHVNYQAIPAYRIHMRFLLRLLQVHQLQSYRQSLMEPQASQRSCGYALV